MRTRSATLRHRVPIFAFSHCRDVVAAVTNAGGIGVLGALAFEPEQLEIELRWIDEHVGGKGTGHLRDAREYVGKGGGRGPASEPARAGAGGPLGVSPRSLAEHGVPPLPPELERKMKAAGSAWMPKGPGRPTSRSHTRCEVLVNALGPPPPYVIDGPTRTACWWARWSARASTREAGEQAST